MTTVNDESSTVIEIEALINRIVTEPVIPWMYDVAQLTQLYQQILSAIPRYLAIYSTAYTYTKAITFFLEHLHHLDVARKDMPFSVDDVDFLVCLILQASDENWFRRRDHDRFYQSKVLNKHLRDYAWQLHQKHSRLLVVRLDLYYSKAAQVHIGINDVYQHLDLITQEKYTNHAVFEHLVGHIWRIEQATDRGYHLHMAYYFLGSKHQNDWYMAKQIGELWLKVTDNLGTYHNCNTPEEKEKYLKKGILGVGMIHRDNSIQVDNAINAIAYLARPDKKDQYLRIKPRNRREFGKGITP